MIGYATVIREIEAFLKKDGLAKTITHADIFERDIYKKNIYPLVNIVPISLSLDDNVTNFQIDVECVDVRDLRKDNNLDMFKMNDNLVDNLNTSYAILRRLFDHLKRHPSIGIEMLSNGTPIVFENDNTLDGWVISFNIEYEETQQVVC